mmetsp:Transcript_33108/g.72948  ORF Transcript_33108/g.72948 Transcript_33108/m.72948 type:complete len:161 (+) Transcript_33108:162-644(+)
MNARFLLLTRALQCRAIPSAHIPFTNMCARMSTIPSTPKLFDFQAPVSEDILSAVSLDTANSKEICRYKISKAIHEHQLHRSDTGSASSQIAAMTQRLQNLARHFAQHRKDKHSNRGFQMLAARRKRMMQYMLRTDLPRFEKLTVTLGLEKEAAVMRRTK